MSKQKLILPISIIAGCIILGGFFYATQISIKNQKDKEYTAMRKMECYSIYEKELDRWSNTKDFRYNKEKDTCVIIYYNRNWDWEEGQDDYIIKEF